MTIREVYDFDVNDEFHFSESIYNNGAKPPGAYQYIILDKHFSKTNDTVFYVRSTNGYTASVNWDPEPHLEYSFYSSKNTVFYTNLDSLVKPPYKTPSNDSCDFFSDSLYYSSQYWGTLVYEYSQCFGCCFEGRGYTGISGRGLGTIYYKDSYGAMFYESVHNLFYFKKGLIEGGTKDNILTSIFENQKKDKHISVYSNEFGEMVFEIIEIRNKFKELEIYKLTGQKIKSIAVNSNKIIFNRSDFNIGCYLYRLVDNSGNYFETGKFIVQ